MQGRAVLLVVLYLLLTSVSLGAHDLPVEVRIAALVKVELDTVRLLIRVPLDLLKDAQFPVTGDVIDRPAAGPAAEWSLNAIANSITIWENDARLVASPPIHWRISLPSNRAFEDFDSAAAHLRGPVSSDHDVYPNQGFFDAELIYPIASPSSVFGIRTTMAPELGDYVKLHVQYLPLDDASRALQIGSRSGRVAFNPTWLQAARSFVSLGINHVLGRTDYVLFLLCIVLPFRRPADLLPGIVSFIAAQSAILIGAAHRAPPSSAWFTSLIETGLAGSILYVAIDNIVGTTRLRRCLVAGVFGIIYGLAFLGALQEGLQFAGSHFLVSLLSFNIGLVLAQLAIVVVMMSVLFLLLRGAFAGRMGIVVLSALAANVGWDWIRERGILLWRSAWPELDTISAIFLARWIVALFIVIVGARFLLGRVQRRALARQDSARKFGPATTE